MKKRLGIITMCCTLMIGAFLPLTNVDAANSTVTISADSVNVREGPGLSYPLVTKVNKGEKYTFLDEKDDWIKLQLTKGKIGWVANWLANIDKMIMNETNTGAVTGDNVNVRRDPSLSGSVIGKLSKNSTVVVFSQKGSWTEIGFQNQKAWISSQFIKVNTNGQKQTTSPPSTSNKTTGTITANGINVRSSASLNSKILGSVNKGQSFTIVEEVNNWDKIEYKSGKYGWVAGWYIEKSTTPPPSTSGQAVKESTVTILQNGTNIRKSPDLSAAVLLRANEGEIFPVTKVKNDWYEIKLKNGTKGYIAGWIVSYSGTSSQIDKPGSINYLKNKTIVLDPGHGGIDNGTTGTAGTLEKNVTLKTAKLLYDKLSAAGANVILTRNNDSYIPLPSRVSTAVFQQADAFISLHYDSISDRSIRGMTGYYYHSYQKPLAEYIYNATVSQTRLKNRGIRFGDFHVIRENSQKATLLELGYLSNAEEELTINTDFFQESAATGIYNGLNQYFKE